MSSIFWKSKEGYQKLATCDPNEENEWNEEWKDKNPSVYLKEEINSMMVDDDDEKTRKPPHYEKSKARFVWENISYDDYVKNEEDEDDYEPKTINALHDQSSNPLFCAGLMILEWFRCLGSAVPVDVAMFISNSKDHDY